MKDIYNIGELVEELKINKETIRYYEKISLLSEPKRDVNGYRVYRKEDIDKIRFIIMVKDYGFSLKEIKILQSKIYDEILGGDLISIKNIVENKINEINNKISELADTKELLQKVNDNILSEKKECCNDIEIYSKK